MKRLMKRIKRLFRAFPSDARDWTVNDSVRLIILLNLTLLPIGYLLVRYAK
jgi:hypothetical protein